MERAVGVSRILVVEDEPIIRMLLTDNLADAGYSVTAARNGAEALDRVRQQPSDIVLLDLLMPGMDGFTFLRERQARPSLARVPVVVLSAAGIDGLREASKLQATAVLAKPVDLEVLAAVIEHVLVQWRPTSASPRPRDGVGSGPIAADWPDADRYGVHSIDSALGSAAMHRLWHVAMTCTRRGCRHVD